LYSRKWRIIGRKEKKAIMKGLVFCKDWLREERGGGDEDLFPMRKGGQYTDQRPDKIQSIHNGYQKNITLHECGITSTVYTVHYDDYTVLYITGTVQYVLMSVKLKYSDVDIISK
jgi:hypothetical protein